MRYAIDEILYFRRVLFLRGWGFCAEGGELALSLVLPGGERLPVAHNPLPSPDVARVWGEPAARCRFDTHVALSEGLAYESLLAASLEFRAPSGALQVVALPWRNPLRNDRFWDQRALVDAVAQYRGGRGAGSLDPGWDPVDDSEKVFRFAMQPLAGARVLEIGSRARSGVVRRQLFPGAEYVGFDIRDGENVDLVGDAHRLASHFEPESFDLVFNVSVFEHLAVPLQVVLQINQVLRPGGLVVVNTHQSWPAHDEPWDYHRFSEHTWGQLFNPRTGFEVLEAVMGEPCYLVPATLAPHYRGLERQRGYLATRCIARKSGVPQIGTGLELRAEPGDPYGH